MRLAFALALLVGLSTLARAQEPAGPNLDKRFGIPVKLKAYPQDTARKALASAVEAGEKPDVAYLVAHLLDPGFVEQRLADRAKQFEPAVELELTKLRDFQNANPDKFLPSDRLPNDRVQFKALVAERSRERAFKQLVADVGEKLRDDPESLKDMKKILRGGTFTDEPGGGAKAVHPEVKDRALFFKKIGERWFLENRHEDVPKKGPGM
jgi:hypothetical protein